MRRLRTAATIRTFAFHAGSPALTARPYEARPVDGKRVNHVNSKWIDARFSTTRTVTRERRVALLRSGPR